MKIALPGLLPRVARFHHIEMNSHFENTIRAATGAKQIFLQETIQSLWSGYGKIVRYGLEGADLKSVVVKHVQLPKASSHPRGWNTDLSHQRKVRSYEVETAWYESWSKKCPDPCKVPRCFEVEHQQDEVLMVLEDLDTSGFGHRKTHVDWTSFEACLRWLAYFHVTFLGVKANDLWETGTYWHLDTRPEELQRMDDDRLRKAAGELDRILKQSPYQTLVHGDAKLANFCFSEDGASVAAVDFQYVGGGCGMKDLAYFVGSCFREEECERLESKTLDTYFKHVRTAAAEMPSSLNIDLLEADWRKLYPVAWTDFHRFLKGWSPGHWKINSYSERLERSVLNSL